jgi:hypothetical protein
MVVVEIALVPSVFVPFGVPISQHQESPSISPTHLRLRAVGAQPALSLSLPCFDGRYVSP